MEGIEITVLSSRVLDALSTRGLKEKTIREFERYGTRRIVSHCLDNGWAVYSKEAVQAFVQQERARMESGVLQDYQWSITRRAAVYLDQMAAHGEIQAAPLRKWEAEHNPLFQPAIYSRADSMKIVDVICRTRDAVMELDLSDKTKTNYIYCGFSIVLKFFISRGEENYSREVLDLFVKTTQANYKSGAIRGAAFHNRLKAVFWILEYLSTGRVTQGRLTNHNFVYAPSGFEDLLREFQMYMDDENYLKEGTRKAYISAVRNFFRAMDAMGKSCYADITLLDITNCLIKISEAHSAWAFNMIPGLRAFARFMAEKHPEFSDIAPALVFSAAKRRRVYEGYSREEAEQILSVIDRSSVIGKRDFAMIMIADSTGLRGCDIVSLKFESIDWNARELRLVQEKTSVPLALPLDTKTLNAIADYILHARPECESDFVFLRVQRPYTKLTSMWTMVAKYAHMALGADHGMDGPHGFRRGMGRRLVEADVPASMICDVLGHTSSMALRQYTASSLEKLKVCAGTIASIPVEQEALL